MREKKAGDLSIVLSNKGVEKKPVSLAIQLPDAVGFDRTGMSRAFRREFDVSPGSSKQLRLPVYVSSRASEGLHPGKMVVEEMSQKKDYVVKNYSKGLSFRIIR